MSTLAGFRGRFADGSKRALLGKKRQQDFEQNFILFFFQVGETTQKITRKSSRAFFLKKDRDNKVIGASRQINIMQVAIFVNLFIFRKRKRILRWVWSHPGTISPIDSSRRQ